jgi:tRNA threonylcarbamoyladenosine modification (KEOPS) complex  Pcc1 subunit
VRARDASLELEGAKQMQRNAKVSSTRVSLDRWRRSTVMLKKGTSHSAPDASYMRSTSSKYLRLMRLSLRFLLARKIGIYAMQQTTSNASLGYGPFMEPAYYLLTISDVQRVLVRVKRSGMAKVI